MSDIEYTRIALKDIERLTDFLIAQYPEVAFDTAKIIVDAINILQVHPEIGRRVGKQYREFIISRGSSGYLALYHYHPKTDLASVIAVRHQRESGYKSY
jgi:plasmid stabilization system protein ParE